MFQLPTSTLNMNTRLTGVSCSAPQNVFVRSTIQRRSLRRSSRPQTIVAAQKTKKSKKSTKKEVSWVGPPLDVVQKKVLTPTESKPSPWWSTFSGHCDGKWTGRMTAFSPLTAEKEPLDLSSEAPVFDLPVETLVTRFNEGELGPSAAMRQQTLRTDKTQENEVLESQATMFYNEPGLVYFEDGSYSRGPLSVDVVAGQHEGDSRTETVETSLAFPGEQRRVRVFQTIQFQLEDPQGLEEDEDEEETVSGGKDSSFSDDDKLMRIQLLQVRVVEEKWAGPLGLNLAPVALAPATDLKRTPLHKTNGDWCSFYTQATPIQEDQELCELDSPQEQGLGEGEPCVRLIYETEEVSEKWIIADSFYPEGDASVLCLPDQISAFVKLGQNEDCPPLSIGIAWNVKKDLQIQLAREYDEDGQLARVRSNTAVRAQTHKGFKR